MITARLAPCWAAFRRQRGGSVTITTALLLTAIIGFTALSVDGASYFNAKRRQQSATDMAALAAATDLTAATSSASSSVTANSYKSTDIAKLEYGTYTPDPSLASNLRFVPAPTSVGANAVRVTMATTPDFIFGKALRSLLGTASQATGFDVRTRGTAAIANAADFSLGTGLATLDGGLLNQILGAMFGTNLSLSLLDYQNLAATKIDLLSFSDALASQVSLQGTTYDSLLALSVAQPKIFSALQTTLQGTAAVGAVATLSTQLAGRAPGYATLTLAKIVAFGPYGARIVGTAHPLSAQVSVLDFVTALARLGADGQIVKTNLSVTVPGVASATMSLVLGQPAKSVSLNAAGAIGTTLTSAQARLLVTFQLVGSGQASLVNVPVLLDLAPGVARLTSLACSAGSSSAGATLGVTSGIAQAWIGTATDSALLDLTASPITSPAVLLNIANIVKMTGQAYASVQNTSQMDVAFSAADITGVTKKTTSTTTPLTSLVTSLVNTVSVKTTVLGGFGLSVGLDNTVTQIVQGAAPAMDSVLASVLASLGIAVGNATTWVSGVRCGQSTLVN